MAKSIIKEVIIILLLCLVIILVLGILLYKYVPISKTIPNQVSYTTPEEVKQELLTSEDVSESQIVMTYEIDSSDLNNYKRIQDYIPGKANPFSSFESQVTSSDTDNASASSTTQTNQTSNNANTSGVNNNTNNTKNTTTSEGQFFQDKGTK